MYTQLIVSFAAILSLLSIVPRTGFGGDTPAKPDPIAVEARSIDLEHLLPDSTLGFVAVKNVPQLIERWNRLGFRSPFANPALQAVISRVEEQFPQPWLDGKFDWSQLLSLPTGQACMAVVEALPGKPAIVIGMDVRGRHEEAIAFFDRLGRGLPPNQNPSHEETLGKTRVVRYSSLSYFLKDDLLVVATNPHVTKELLRSWPGSKGIVEGEAYRAVFEQCQAGMETVGPDICCFLRPIQFLSSRMALKKSKPPMTWQDYLKQAKLTGFDAICGIGGACWFDRDPHALLYRVGVYAPDHTGWAMKTLCMPNRQEHEPPAWVPQDVEAFGDFYWEMQQAFKPFCKVFSVAIEDIGWGGDDVFDGILDSLRDDPNGPQFDYRKEFVERLGDRVLVFRGAYNPNASVWNNTVVGLKITDEAAVLKSLEKCIRKCRKNEPYFTITEHKVSESILYEVKEIEQEEEDRDARHADRPVFVGVAHECLLWGNDGNLLRSLLTAGAPLAKDTSYMAVQHELEKLNAGPVSFRGFARRGDDFGILARCMDAQKFFTPFFLEAQQRDMSEPAAGHKKASELSIKATMVGPAGWFAESLPNGWRIVGVVLKPAFIENGAKR